MNSIWNIVDKYELRKHYTLLCPNNKYNQIQSVGKQIITSSIDNNFPEYKIKNFIECKQVLDTTVIDMLYDIQYQFQRWLKNNIDTVTKGLLLIVHEISETKSLQKALATHHKNCAPFLQIKDLFYLPQLPRSPLGKIRFAEISDLLTQVWHNLNAYKLHYSCYEIKPIIKNRPIDHHLVCKHPCPAGKRPIR